MFETILIANRGEIAVRVMQTCAEMGIRGVAVYSAADARALHRRRADASYCIGPAPATSSYLAGERIIAVARQAGAQAIHPGYGFLAENAEFADACRAAGLVFIGPPAAVMRRLGDKRAARQLAVAAGVPVVPGADDVEQTPAALAAAARAVGFPLLIKAAAGGGGKGMRLVRAPDAFAAALEGARREAGAAFGDDAVLLERYIEAPRHVEFQVMADTHGRVVHLGERECSVQRRHQKVIEESPSPALTPALRAAMGEATVAVARAAGYVNAGTVEFLLAPDGAFYFLEVNTRLQVEHPVTELVTGLDLVREQVRVAAGLPLSFDQADIQPRGHAIECRVYAEDARQGFLPSTGQLAVFQPPLGPGLRHDTGVEAGDEVSPHYDPLLAKLIVGAADRAACIDRAVAALRRYQVLGVTTNLGLLREVLDSPPFRAGDLSTDFLERHLAARPPDPPPPAEALLAAAGWRLTAATAPATPDIWRAGSWRLAGQDLALDFDTGQGRATVRASRQADGRWRLSLPASDRVAGFERAGPTTLVVQEEGRHWEARVAEQPAALQIDIDGVVYALAPAAPPGLDERGRGVASGGHANALRAPMPGTVVKVHAQPGEGVSAGQPLLVLEAMKMEHTIAAPHDGTLVRLHYALGDSVPAGAVLAEVDE